MNISEWRPVIKNTLRGFFTVTLPSGITIYECTLHEKGGREWIAFPARQYTGKDGEQKWQRLISINDKTRLKVFSAEVLQALSEYSRTTGGTNDH